MTRQIRFYFAVALRLSCFKISLRNRVTQPLSALLSTCVLQKTAQARVPAPLKRKLLQTRRRLGGRQPLCGIGVTSLICTMCNPAEARARTADSRPEPGPLMRTSIDFMPYWSRATPAAEIDACWAA